MQYIAAMMRGPLAYLHQLLLQLLWACILLLQVGHLLRKCLQACGRHVAGKGACRTIVWLPLAPSLRAGDPLSRSASQTRKSSISDSRNQTAHLAQQEGARRGGGRVRRTPAVGQEQLQQAGRLL